MEPADAARMDDDGIMTGFDGLTPDTAQTILEFLDRQWQRRGEFEIGFEIGQQLSHAVSG
jgi:hypothetical protein